MLILNLALAAILGLILIVVIKELITYRRMKVFGKGNCTVLYQPFSGFTGFLRAGAESDDDLSRIRGLINEGISQKKDLLVFNDVASTQPLVMILNNNLLRKFFSMEVEYTGRAPFVEGLYFGYFDEYGQEAIRKRTLFSRFLCKSNVESLIPLMTRITKSYMN